MQRAKACVTGTGARELGASVNETTRRLYFFPEMVDWRRAPSVLRYEPAFGSLARRVVQFLGSAATRPSARWKQEVEGKAVRLYMR